MESYKIVEKIKEFFKNCCGYISKFVTANKYKVFVIGFIIIVIVVGCTTIKGDNNIIVKGSNDHVTNEEKLTESGIYGICTAPNCSCPCKHIGE